MVTRMTTAEKYDCRHQNVINSIGSLFKEAIKVCSFDELSTGVHENVQYPLQVFKPSEDQ